MHHYTLFIILASTFFLLISAHEPSNVDFSSPYCLNGLSQDLIFQPQLLTTPSSQHLLHHNSSQPLQSWIELPQVAPWTFPPVCATKLSDSDNDELFCVFSAQDFSSGRGISLLSTPSDAAALLKTPAFDPSYSSSMDTDESSPPVIKQEVPGKGIGLLASRTLNRGDRIFSKTPLLLLHSAIYLETNLETHTRQRLIEIAIKQLPKESREIFYSQMGDSIDDRIDTNAFYTEVNGDAHLGVYPETAQINHECRPTTLYYFDPKTLRHYIHAATTIFPGEELSVSYINVRQKREDRIKNLHNTWGFRCTCSACSLPAALSDQSDARLAKIDSLIKTLNNWSTENAEIDPTAGDLLVSLYEQERLWIGRTVAYQIAALNWNGVGDRWKAVRYAMLAVEYGIIDDGPDVWFVREMMLLVENPEQHWSWMKRTRAS